MVLQSALHRIGRISIILRDDVRAVDLIREIEVLFQAIENDLETERFYHYPKAKGLMVLQYPGEWNATLKAFPSTEADIKGAVDCYALGHDRGSIYHSMMILERGLPALAKRIEVPIRANRDSWGPIIDNIRKEIDSRQKLLASPPRGSAPPSPRRAKAERDLLKKCADAAMEFRYFADVWRNHIAHGRGNYDENDAKKVLDHVKSYMEFISNDLKLREKR